MDIKGISGLIILLASIISIIPAFSKGDAFLGVIAVLSATVFVLVLMQVDEDECHNAFNVIPYAGVTMIAISAIIYLFPDIKHLAFETNRLAGPFHYANTLALFLLFGIIIEINGLKNLEKKEKDLLNSFICLVLLLGILWTGSRTTFILAFILIIYYAISMKEKRKYLLLLAGFIIVFPVAAGLILGITETFGRITTFTLSSSTFVGRMLYIEDALPVILSHPLGLGHLGYMMIQPVIQTGVYSVRYIHNEYLQIMLDYGWVAGAALVVLLVTGFRGIVAKQQRMKAGILICTAVHMLLDFDLQYLIIVFIIMMCMDWKNGKSFTIGKRPAMVVSVCLMISGLWLCTAFIMKDINPKLASKMYPWSYEIVEKLTMTSKDVNTVEGGAKGMLEMNPYSYEAYNALGDVAIYRNDIYRLMDMKWKCLEIGAFHDIFYTEFRQILDYALQSPDQEMVEKALEYRQKLDNLISRTEEKTSPLARRIRDRLTYGK